MRCVINDASFAGLNSSHAGFAQQLATLVDLRNRVFETSVVGAHFVVYDLVLACGEPLVAALYARCTDPLVQSAILDILANSPQSAPIACACEPPTDFQAACIAVHNDLPLLSVASASHWNADFFAISHDCNGTKSQHRVLNFSKRTHLSRTHFAWLREKGATALQQFRALAADPDGYKHRLASSYGGKHVKGPTNILRKASAITGGGQYFANGDKWITDVESAVLAAADSSDRDATITAEGGSIHVIMRHTEMVGYASPSGSETDLVRVEVTWQREVHSHPRDDE